MLTELHKAVKYSELKVIETVENHRGNMDDFRITNPKKLY
jgi:hypothetical protein